MMVRDVPVLHLFCLTRQLEFRTLNQVAVSAMRDTQPSVAPSFNGRTSDSDSLDRGSNPWGATKSM